MKNIPFHSRVEERLVHAEDPIAIDEKLYQEITINGEKGLWLNKDEMDNFWSDGNTDEYLINKDSNPHIIIKKPTNSIELKQNIEISYLRPPTPPSPGEIIIEKEPNKTLPPGPPLIIRQIPPKAKENNEPLIVREAPPPSSLTEVKQHIITIPGKLLPPPPRKIIINREYYYINDCKLNKSRSRKNTTNSEKNEAKERKTSSSVSTRRRAASSSRLSYDPRLYDKTEEYITAPTAQSIPPPVYYLPQPSYTYAPQIQQQRTLGNYPVYYNNYY